MLKLQSLAKRRSADDTGAVLVTVVVVMLVGFVIAVTIAASVMFTIGANASNKDNTQAFIAAESGRDAALANVMRTPCVLTTNPSTTAPIYRDVVTTSGPDAGSLTSACPSTSAPSVIRISSTGLGPDGAEVKVTSTYERVVTYVGQPGGVMAYFSGQFKATQSLYEGDLVIRDGKYLCNSATVIDGDLWVPRGGIELSADCEIRGNLYAEGDVLIKSAKAIVKGMISARGSITIDASNAVIDGDLKSSKNIRIDAGTVKGSAYAAGNFVANGGPLQGSAYAGGTATEKKATDVVGTLNPGNPGPVADPAVPQSDLDAVFVMTTWVDLPLEPSFWGSDVKWHTGPCNGADVTSLVTAPLTAPLTRVGIDYRGCTGPVTVYLAGGTMDFTHDAVFLLNPASKLTVVTGNINSTGAPPQLFFVQGDNMLGNSVPNCGAGMASGDLTLGSTLDARLMFYTPCGFKNTNHVTFNGQLYANTDGSAHWVHPEFLCEPMEWLPMLDLSCEITTASTGGGTSTPILGPPTLISQTEQ
ncbi:hypothetical protein ACFT30_17915 [Microbacterium ureisolvens]|uniref:hypothetical protein n=1 Tax=Microbacterium ureisolvens TaxID=2781186 RepID=UPI00363C2325